MTPSLLLTIDPALSFLLRGKWKGAREVVYKLTRRASIKDILEAIGIPHTEIGRLSTTAEEINFSYIPSANERLTVEGIAIPFAVTQPSHLRPHPYRHTRFLTDLNVGKLASLLRLAGLDTLEDGNRSDEALAALAAQEERILLTKDRLLLCRNAVRFGRLIRHADPYAQLAEVIEVFGLRGKVKPFSRCLKCNAVLEAVSKESVLPRLLPLTRKYYQDFKRCPDCDSLYWKGSHRDGMEQSLRRAGLAWLAEMTTD